MITEQGTVVGFSEKGVWVETARRSTCGSCVARSGCGQNLLNRFLGKQMQVEASVSSDQSELLKRLQPGDTVEIGIAENAILCGSLITYGLPIVFLVLSVVVAEQISTILAVPAASVGLVFGYLVSRWVLRNFFSAPDFEPRVLKQLLQTPTAGEVVITSKLP